jgi:hypothetical protein
MRFYTRSANFRYDIRLTLRKLGRFGKLELA